MTISPGVPLLLAAALFLFLPISRGTVHGTQTTPTAPTAPRPPNVPIAPQMVLQIGHEGAVKAVAVAPDGKRIATGGSEGAVRLWDAQSGALLSAWQTHRDEVTSLQFAPHGGLLASSGRDGKVVLRDVRDLGAMRGMVWGMVRATLNASGPIRFSPDGAMLAAGLPDPKYPGAYARPALWSTSNGQRKRVFGITSFDSAAFSPDGGVLATSSGGVIYLWDTRSGRRLRSLNAAPIYTVTALAFSADGKQLACGGEIVRLFDVATGDPLRNVTANLGAVRLVAFLPDGRLLTVADDAARLWNGQSFERERTVRAPKGGFGALALSQDGKSLLCAGGDAGLTAGGGLRLLQLDPSRWRVLPMQAAQRSEPHNLYFSADGKTLALTVGRSSSKAAPGAVAPSGGAPSGDASSGDAHGEIWLWKPGVARPARVLALEDEIFHAVPLSGGRTLFSEADFALTRHDVASGARRSFGDWENGVGLVAVSPNGALAAGAYPTRPARLFDARSGKPVRTIQTVKDVGKEQEVWSWLVFSPDSTQLATASADNTVRLWSTSSGRCQKTWKLPDIPGEIVFSPNGRWMAAGGENGDVWRWPRDGTAAPRALKGHQGAVICLAVAPDGRTLASGGEDGTVRVWDAASGRLVRSLKPNAGAIHAVRFTPGGVLLCAAKDGQLQSWDARSGRLRLTLRFLPGKGNWVAWTPAGLFDAAPGAARFLRWRQGAKWLSQLSRLRRPEIIARAWGF